MYDRRINRQNPLTIPLERMPESAYNLHTGNQNQSQRQVRMPFQNQYQQQTQRPPQPQNQPNQSNSHDTTYSSRNPYRYGYNNPYRPNFQRNRNDRNYSQDNRGNEKKEKYETPPSSNAASYTQRQNPLSSLFGGKLGNIISQFKTEDILLCGIILLLLNEEEKDYELIIALAIIFLSGFGEDPE